MYNRLNNYLDANKIIVDNQYGFRKEHSTYMDLLKMINDITNEQENKNYSQGVFIDLSKAFNTVDHNILIKKMYHYRIRLIVLDWFTNYLCNRKQYVSINNVNSNMLPVACGVPQGSILGSLLFILFINDITSISKLAELIMFADDTKSIFFKHANISELFVNVNNELQKVSKWFKLNKLSLNIKKN